MPTKIIISQSTSNLPRSHAALGTLSCALGILQPSPFGRLLLVVPPVCHFRRTHHLLVSKSVEMLGKAARASVMQQRIVGGELLLQACPLLSLLGRFWPTPLASRYNGFPQRPPVKRPTVMSC